MSPLWESAGLEAEVYADYVREMDMEEAVSFLQEAGVSKDDARHLVNELHLPRIEEDVCVTATEELVEVTSTEKEEVKDTRRKKILLSGNALGSWLNTTVPKNPHDAARTKTRPISSSQILDERGSSFICGVCLDVALEPLCIDCNGEHVACTVCWTQFVAAARNKSLEVDLCANVEQSRRLLNCPLCKQFVPIQATPLGATPRWEKYCALVCICDREGCSWRGCLRELEAHREWCDWEHKAASAVADDAATKASIIPANDRQQSSASVPKPASLKKDVSASSFATGTSWKKWEQPVWREKSAVSSVSSWSADVKCPEKSELEEESVKKKKTEKVVARSLDEDEYAKKQKKNKVPLDWRGVPLDQYGYFDVVVESESD